MKSCLIVDHSDLAGFVIERIFQAMGFAASRSSNGEKALEICAADTPDIVLVDWKIPGLSALKFVRDLRDLTLEKQPAVIYCTTENDLGHIEKALAAGADDYLLKPFDRKIMESKLGTIGVSQAQSEILQT